MKDKAIKAYNEYFRGRRDFNFSTRGIRSDIDQEFLVVGGFELVNDSRLVMRNPSMVIGTDRMELYEFLARRKETMSQNNRSFLKLAIAITAVHFALVQIPQLSSRFFGDNVDKVSSTVFGAQDQSDMQ